MGVGAVVSMIRCSGCDRILDAKDEGLEGVYEDAKPYRYWCPDCLTEPDALKALKIQDPDRYIELVGEYE